MSKSILVIGATGQQGSAFIKSIQSSPSSNDFTLIGLTRDTKSASSNRLADSGVKVIEGDLKDVPTVFKKATAFGPLWGVFIVLIVPRMGSPADSEETQGKAIVDEAVAQNVKYIVYSSVDRGGSEQSWNDPTDVPHFASKHNVEIYLRDKTKGTNVKWTVLRPVAFMDNCKPGMFARIFFSLWRLKVPTQKLQLICTADIGRMAAICFTHSEKYENKAISIAGSSITFQEAHEIFKAKTGQDLPEVYQFVAQGFSAMLNEVNLMFTWFAQVGYKADIEECRQMYPELMDFGTWLDKESGWKQ